MSKKDDRIKQIFELIEELYKDTPYGVLITAVEVNDAGYPSARALKCHANPAQTIAAITITQKMLTETLEGVFERIETASEVTNKIDAVMDKMKEVIESSADADQSSDEAEKLRKFIEDFKKRMGK